MTTRASSVVIDYTPSTHHLGPRWLCRHPTGEADYPDRSAGQLLHLAAGRLADLDALAPRPDGLPHAATFTAPAQAAILARLTAPSVADLAARLTETLCEPMPSTPLAALAALIAEATT